jgi:hypothetical protein
LRVGIGFEKATLAGGVAVALEVELALAEVEVARGEAAFLVDLAAVEEREVVVLLCVVVVEAVGDGAAGVCDVGGAVFDGVADLVLAVAVGDGGVAAAVAVGVFVAARVT